MAFLRGNLWIRVLGNTSMFFRMSPFQLLLILFLISSSLISIAISSSDYTNLIFKGCADQSFPDYKKALNILFDSLISQSYSAKFYKATAGAGSTTFNGLFQCRGDLSSKDCKRCVKKAPSMVQKLCGDAVAARVQLNGCYLRYEAYWFRPAASATDLLYKMCDPDRAEAGAMDGALDEITKGVESGGGFYSGGYQSVYMVGQCEGDLARGECVACVKNATEMAKSECGDSVSAQVYLQECYVTYRYYPNVVPTDGRNSVSSSPENMATKSKLEDRVQTGVGEDNVAQVLVNAMHVVHEKFPKVHTGVLAHSSHGKESFGHSEWYNNSWNCKPQTTNFRTPPWKS